MKSIILRLIGVIFGVTIFGGILFFGLIIASLSGIPPYCIYALAVAGGGLILAGAISASGFLPEKGLKPLWLVFALVAASSAAYAGYGFWEDSIPTVDDRQLILSEYWPFEEGTKAASLDEESTLQLNASEVLSLRLDGATALYPVYSAFVQATFPERQYPLYTSGGVGMVTCTGTIRAYERLIKRETDMIFAAAPSQAQLDAAEAAGLELHMTPIGKEAFVFFVNSKNPVAGLTVEQIQGIYTGEITNWKDVGGRNQSIRPYQRAENSGSQSALLRLMEGLPLMEPEKEDRVGGMGGIIRQVASYRNHKNAIGFSFRFYATEMDSSDQIRLLALNGVEPTKETIRDGSYPISSYFYAVTASAKGKPAPQEIYATMKAFTDWMLSDQGQELVERSGYVSLN